MSMEARVWCGEREKEFTLEGPLVFRTSKFSFLLRVSRMKTSSRDAPLSLTQLTDPWKVMARLEEILQALVVTKPFLW